MPAVRSVFISDVHLGTRACQAGRLLEFLREYPSDHLYLIGDIIDFWAMNRSIQWSGTQNTVVQKVLRRARHGCLRPRSCDPLRGRAPGDRRLRRCGPGRRR